jgi:hypothetical protein
MRILALTVLALLALSCAIPRRAAAAVPGVNLTTVTQTSDGWTRIAQSQAKTVRVWAFTSQLESSPGHLNPSQVSNYLSLAQQAKALGVNTLITLMGAPGSAAPPDTATYTRIAGEFAAALKGNVAAYEIWNEPDDSPFWANPSPAAYAALLKAAYPAIKAGDPNATVVSGGLVANDYDFVQALYANGAKGSFDALGIHTDTACLTTDPREYYREPSGRIGRYSFTGYREVHRTMLANGDDKPIWMTEIGWSTTDAICNRGERAGTKPGGVSLAQQADFLTKAYGCLANDPYVAQAIWFSLADVDSASPDYDRRLGLLDQSLNPKPAFSAFAAAGGVGAIPCGGVVDTTPPTVRILAPTSNTVYLAALPISITADDDQGVTNVDVFMDGKEIPVVTKSQTATAAKVALDWQGAKKLAYGPHTLLVKAYDEAKNVGTATAKVTKVGGGRYKIAIATRLNLKLGRVAHRRISVRGSVIPAQKLASVAGKTQITFERRQGRRWIGTSRFSKGAKSPFHFTYRFKKPGIWRVKARFVPKRGSSYKPSTVPTRVLHVA